MTMFNVPNKVLVIVAHQDDETIGCGGTIRKWSDSGSKIHVVFVTNGSTGISQDSKALSKKNIESIRMKEAKTAASVLGIETVSTLGVDCQCVSGSQDLFHSVISEIRKVKPNIVITHHSGDKHRDHKNVSAIVKEACWKANENIHKELGPPHKIDDLWAAEVVDILPEVDFVVDITETYEHKLAAMDIYLSQHGVVEGVFDNISGLSKIRGYSIGKKRGEAFARISNIPISC
jgi:LmbE family N-acetylglucosaminyl deacetylase|tara:strand:+ start:625 stop:1323 length:699 start_codon:yes stop_codon:yes gene_type:complete